MFDSITAAKDFPLYTTIGVSASAAEMNIEDLKVNFPSPYFKSYYREVTNPKSVFLWDEAELKCAPLPQVPSAHRPWDLAVAVLFPRTTCIALHSGLQVQNMPFFYQTPSQLPDIFRMARV